MAANGLTSGSGTDNADQYLTDSVRVDANSVVFIFVTSASGSFLPAVPTQPTVSFAGAALTEVKTSTTTDRRLTCFRLSSAQAQTSNFTIDFGGETQDYCAWSAFAYADADLAQPVVLAIPANGQGLTAAAALTAPADTAHTFSAAAIALSATQNITPPARFTQVHQVQVTQGLLAKTAALQSVAADDVPSQASWQWAVGAEAAIIAIEIKAAVPVGPGTTPSPTHPDEALIRRFEPILVLHTDEKYVPVNAKRFVESSALWSAGSPADDNTRWGGAPTSPFPRKPTVSAGGLTAIRESSGTFLGDVLGGENQEHFLELAGWKDLSEAHEAGVTGATSNIRADRTAIANRYSSDLKDSSFWYHAEVFRADRLATLASRSVAPNLKPVLKALHNPTLLCYYLFFPAHEQSVLCSTPAAQEVSCHAGDWQCVAVMLEGDGTGDLDGYSPKYLGLTGSRPVAGPKGYPAHQFDDDNLTAMTVRGWNGADTPETVRGHPRFYVTLGTHSLSLSPGDHSVDPYPESAVPQDCATFDGPGLVPPAPPPGPDVGPGDVAAGWAAILGKIVAGAKAGGLLGGVLGAAAGGWAGLVAGVYEVANNDLTLGEPFGAGGPQADKPAPEKSAGAANAGRTIRPAGLPITGVADAVDWVSAQGVSHNGRTYDYIVDRPTQIWWPSDDGETGYHGRWGQRVVSDSLGRRAGPRFPDYVRMMLMALADGAHRQIFPELRGGG
jgi:hypothetical protein